MLFVVKYKAGVFSVFIPDDRFSVVFALLFESLTSSTSLVWFVEFF